MKSNWRKQMMISALALTLSAANAAPVFASAAPDGKSNAAEIAQTMGTTTQWNRWQKEWETLKNDWTQISLSPGSNATELNFAWYTPKQTNDNNSNADVEAKVQAISPDQKDSNVPKLIIGEGRNMKNAKVYEDAGAAKVVDEQQFAKNPHHLAEEIIALLHDEDERNALSRAIQQFAKPHAASDIVDMLYEAANHKQYLIQ